MRMLATGQNCLPAAGIGAMAEQLAAKLPTDYVYTGTQLAPSSHDGMIQTVFCESTVVYGNAS